MGRKKNNTSTIFDALASAGISGNDPQDTNASFTNVDDYVIDNNSADDVTNLSDPAINAVDNTGTKDPHDDDSEIPQDVLNNIDNASSDNNDDSDNQDDDDLDNNNDDDIVAPEEEEQVGAFFDAFAEALNWQVDEDERPTTVQGIIDYMTNVVKENSVPQYADERIQKLDEYVKNGGSFDDFYNGMSQEIQYDSINMEDETNQKTIIREYLKYQGYSDEQINSKIERYEDADMLEDEATDAVERMKQIHQANLEQQEEEQRRLFEQQQEQTKQFVTDLNNTVSNLSTIRGISIPKEDRKKLYDYITRVDENGLTQYQKDFNSNLVNNLVESAYFTMKGDALINGAKDKGRTDAATKLRNVLRHSTKNRSSQGIDDNKRSALDMASKFFG